MFSALVLAAATANFPALPVQLRTCDIAQPIVSPQSGDLGGFETIRGYQLHVRFTNVATEPITKVVFALNDGTTVADSGTFSPAVAIDHTIALNASEATGCAVQSVVLADGRQLAMPILQAF